MGVVYRGLHPVIKKRVAIKVIKPAYASDQQQVKRLQSEAEAVNAIGHRAIIDIFGLGALGDGRPYIIMEYLDGEPLDLWLRRQGRLPLTIALELLIEVCGPLAAAHKAGVIHRDLKPSNIFLCSQPDGSRYLKLLDFGLAKRAMGLDGTTAQTSQAVVSGTPDYMAPEQARALPISPRSDIYALGVVAYELLTGTIPYSGETPMDVMVGHVSKPVPHIRALEPGVPATIDELVAQMMAKEPEARPQSIDVVRELLEEALVSGGATPAPSQRNLPRLRAMETATPIPPPRGTPLEARSPPPIAAVQPVMLGRVTPSSPRGLARPDGSIPPVLVPALGAAPSSPGARPPESRLHSPSQLAAAPPPSLPHSIAPAPPWLRKQPAAHAPNPPTPNGALPAPPPADAVTLGAATSTPKRSGVAVWSALLFLSAGLGIGLWALLNSQSEGNAGPPPQLPIELPVEPEAMPLTEGAPADDPQSAEPNSIPAAAEGQPSTSFLFKRIVLLESQGRKKKVGAKALRRLKAFRQQAKTVEAPADREALNRKLDEWEEAFLRR